MWGTRSPVRVSNHPTKCWFAQLWKARLGKNLDVQRLRGIELQPFIKGRVKGFLGQLKGAFPLISLWEGECGWVGQVLEESGLSECKLINGIRDKVGHLSQIGTWFFVLGAEECTGRQWNLVTQRALNRNDTVAGLSEFAPWVSLVDSEIRFIYVLHSGNELHA